MSTGINKLNELSNDSLTGSNLFLGYTPEQWQEAGSNGLTFSEKGWDVTGGTGIDSGDYSIKTDLLANKFGNNTLSNDLAGSGLGSSWMSDIGKFMGGSSGLMDLANFGLGYLSYQDQKKSNDVWRTGENQRIAQNETLAKNKAADRKSLFAAWA